jgi:hypothetical protein
MQEFISSFARRYSKQIDSIGHALKVALAAFGETDICARDQIPHCPGYEALARFGQRRNPGGDVHCNTAQVVFLDFNLTSVKAGPNFDTQ